ncbi:MAG: ribosome assembly factor SBDS [Candidatus Anstonellales archaeon]
MSSLENSIIAHIEIRGKRFEILVDKQNGYDYKIGKKKDLQNVLVAEEVFADFRKGERHRDSELLKAFNTTDVYQIAQIILQKGEIQLTTEQKKKLMEEKRRGIIAIILREAIDPRTKAPHTYSRIEQAMEEAGIRIDPFKPPEAQLEEVIKKLTPIIPLKFERVSIAVKVPADYAHKVYGTLKDYGIKKEEWTKLGELIVVVEIPAGMQGEFYERLNKQTAGAAQTKLLDK